MDFTFPAIGIAHSCFTDTFGIPRQPGLAPSATAFIELLPPYNCVDALDGIELSSHLWLQWVFHANKRQSWKPKVKPPRLGGNKSLGVFATRSPTRPAPIGLSVVKFERIVADEDRVGIIVSGIDLLDGTPILDIKPYIPYVDRVDSATNQFAESVPDVSEVLISADAEATLSELPNNGDDLRQLIIEVLQQDPRPKYQATDPARRYGMLLANYDVQWHYEIGDNGDQIVLDALVARAVE